VKTRSVLDPPWEGCSQSAALDQAVAFARKNGQLALWDRSPRSYGVAYYDDAARRLCPISDQEAAIILNTVASIGREWRRWNAMTGNQGSLIIIEGQRVKAILEAARDEREDDDDVKGLA
jgi:hypothetical protein